MNKACLIIPPSPFLLDERVFPSLGILRVAASLERQGVQVDVLDLSGVANYLDVLGKYMQDNPFVYRFGITATTPQFPAVCRISDKLWEYAGSYYSLDGYPHVTVGGPHPTLVAASKGPRAEKAMTGIRKKFQTIVAGDGDLIPFERMFQHGFINADDPKGDLFMTDAAYEQAPNPARHLIDLSSYHYTVEGKNATSLICQLGCPFQCAFCGGRKSPMLRRIRTRSVDSVIQEIRHVHLEYGHTGFMFYDDELNVSKSMVELMRRLQDLQSELGVDMAFRGFVKSELFDEEQAREMYAAGFRWILTGFESGSPRILENIRKRASRDENTRCVEIAKKHGLKVKALMSIGHAGENVDTVEDTRQWLLETRPEDFDCTIITTYPGTPYYDDAVETSPGIWTYTAKNGDLLHSVEVDYGTTADYYKGSPDGGYKAYVFTPDLSSEDLVSLRDNLESSVRGTLNIPFNPSAAAVNYEHSMGQNIPANILKSSDGGNAKSKPVVRLPVIK